METVTISEEMARNSFEKLSSFLKGVESQSQDFWNQLENITMLGIISPGASIKAMQDDPTLQRYADITRNIGALTIFLKNRGENPKLEYGNKSQTFKDNMIQGLMRLLDLTEKELAN